MYAQRQGGGVRGKDKDEEGWKLRKLMKVSYPFLDGHGMRTSSARFDPGGHTAARALVPTLMTRQEHRLCMLRVEVDVVIDPLETASRIRKGEREVILALSSLHGTPAGVMPSSLVQ